MVFVLLIGTDNTMRAHLVVAKNGYKRMVMFDDCGNDNDASQHASLP
jgi:hypothetical protein